MQYVMPIELHDRIITAAYRARGYTPDEAAAAAAQGRTASRHGIKTHNGLKALALDDHFGAKIGGTVPGAMIEKLPSKFKAVARWNANKKLGQPVGYAALAEAMRLADEFGIGAVAVDNAFHYLWGGGYVIDAADKGYIAYTCCTAALAQVVPFGGKYPTLGTNPHSWGFPTRETVGFPICIDWASSVIAAGQIGQRLREGKMLPPGSAVDKDGNETIDPKQVAALLPFAQHKGYGLALIDELYYAYTGGSLPTLRSRWKTGPEDEKRTPTFFFQCIRPEALDCGDFAKGRSQSQNVKAVIDDILSHGNEHCLLPGQPEAKAAALSDKMGGLLFLPSEIDEFESIAKEAKVDFDRSALRPVQI